jgi:hypothetical protein
VLRRPPWREPHRTHDSDMAPSRNPQPYIPVPTVQVVLDRDRSTRWVTLRPTGISLVHAGFSVKNSERREFRLRSLAFPAPPLPVLGLGLMACKRVAARAATISDCANQPSELEHSLRVEGPLEGEAEKAVKTLRMVGWRSRRQLPIFRVEWCEGAPLTRAVPVLAFMKGGRLLRMSWT